MTELSAFEILAKLVSYPTVSDRSNLELIDWVDKYLSSFDIKTFRKYSEDKSKASLFAHVGPPIEGGVVLSGHTDVVPVEGQDWSSNPWELTEKNNRLYGRGSCDMKGFDALSIWAMIEAKKNDVKRPLQIALSYDEEVGCIGAPPMIEEMIKLLPKASMVIVGEPSTMLAVTGHKGALGFTTHLVGKEVHSSILDRGVSAIMNGAKLIDWANQQNVANKQAEQTETAKSFDPPYTTLHVGVIKGGTAHNITAKDCNFEMDIRVVSDQKVEFWTEKYNKKVKEIESEMKAISADTKIVVSNRSAVPGLRPEINGEAETFVRQITGDNGNHFVSYGTEAGQFQERGYSAVICGPGDISVAHQPDEYLEKSQFEIGLSFMESLIKKLS